MANDIEHLDLGIYDATITGTSIRKSPARGTPYANLACELDGGYNVFVEIWLTHAAQERALEDLGACGFDPAKHSTRDLNKGTDSPLVGSHVAVEIYEDTFKDKTRKKAQIYRESGGSTPTDEDLDKTDALLRGDKKPPSGGRGRRTGSSAKETPEKPAPGAPPEARPNPDAEPGSLDGPTQQEEDDIPF